MDCESSPDWRGLSPPVSRKGGIGMKKYMTSFGVPIVSRVEGGTMEELQESISKKLSAMDVKNFPSLSSGAGTSVGCEKAC